MKKQIVLLAGFILIAIISFAQEKDKEVMVKKIFYSLRDKNPEAFINLFPDGVTFREFVLKSGMAANSPEDSVELESLIGSLTDSSLREGFRESYAEYIKKGEDSGVNWPSAKLVSFTIDSSYIEDEGFKTPALSGKIYFTADSIDFFIEYSQVIWFENKGWYGVEIDRIDKKSREHLKEEYNRAAADSMVMYADTAVTIFKKNPGDNPAGTTKTPVKKSGSKSKTQKPPVKKE